MKLAAKKIFQLINLLICLSRSETIVKNNFSAHVMQVQYLFAFDLLITFQSALVLINMNKNKNSPTTSWFSSPNVNIL